MTMINTDELDATTQERFAAAGYVPCPSCGRLGRPGIELASCVSWDGEDTTVCDDCGAVWDVAD